MSLITKPGAYPDIPSDRYHGAEICPAPSISGTGLKRIAPFTALQTKGCSPRHYWEGSNLNPKRRPKEDSDALRVGRAFHDALLLPDRWADRDAYLILPEGFDRRKTKEQAVEIAAFEDAKARGIDVMTAKEAVHINAMADAMRANPLVAATLSNGAAEVTLAWQDEATGVWLRARPDWLPDNRKIGINIKSTADASFAGFQSDVTKYRYAQSAALELDGIEAVFGVRPTNYLHPVVEKPGPDWQPGDYLPVALWELPADDIEYGRQLNRRAIDLFADCLKHDRWPGYADQPAMCGISGWAKRQIDNAIENEIAA